MCFPCNFQLTDPRAHFAKSIAICQNGIATLESIPELISNWRTANQFPGKVTVYEVPERIYRYVTKGKPDVMVTKENEISNANLIRWNLVILLNHRPFTHFLCHRCFPRISSQQHGRIDMTLFLLSSWRSIPIRNCLSVAFCSNRSVE
jgi:hypothetical protein